MARTKAISLIQTGSTKVELSELSGLVISNIQKETLAAGLKSQSYTGNPATGSVEYKRFKNSASQAYGTARTAGKGAAITVPPTTVNLDIHREIVEEAAKFDLDTFGVGNIMARRADNHVDTVAAELTGYDFQRSHRVHLLTFWPDLDCPALRRHCDIMRQRRNECALQSCREIEALYPQFRTEQALEYAQDSGVLFKSGIMQALQQLGLCDGIYTGLYHELFGWEPRGKCLHSPTYPPVREVLATAKAAGAVVVFAHPTVYKSMPLLRELVAEGAIDGIEVHHPRNSPEDMAECAELCKKHDLIVTGGSDFHGANHGKPHPVGACVTEDDQIARIEALARKRRGGAL